MESRQIAVIGAGVAGLTTAVALSERGARVTILADETGAQTTSAAAGAIWYPYDAEPLYKVIAWSRQSYEVFRRLTADPGAGVSMIELRSFTRQGELPIPDWSNAFGARRLTREECAAHGFASGSAVTVPLIDPGVYLDWLTRRFLAAGGSIRAGFRLMKLEEVGPGFDLVVNCAGIGARELVPDAEMEPHRGQVVIVPRRALEHAIVCDDPPLTYIFPRANDCVLGGTNEISDDRSPQPAATASIIEECTRVLGSSPPRVLAERVGLRPYRRSGVRLESGRLRDGRAVIHNYGHGGCGFTLSWGCAAEVVQLAASF